MRKGLPLWLKRDLLAEPEALDGRVAADARRPPSGRAGTASGARSGMRLPRHHRSGYRPAHPAAARRLRAAAPARSPEPAAAGSARYQRGGDATQEDRRTSRHDRRQTAAHQHAAPAAPHDSARRPCRADRSRDAGTRVRPWPRAPWSSRSPRARTTRALRPGPERGRHRARQRRRRLAVAHRRGRLVRAARPRRARSCSPHSPPLGGPAGERPGRGPGDALHPVRRPARHQPRRT